MKNSLLLLAISVVGSNFFAQAYGQTSSEPTAGQLVLGAISQGLMQNKEELKEGANFEVEVATKTDKGFDSNSLVPFKFSVLKIEKENNTILLKFGNDVATIPYKAGNEVERDLKSPQFMKSTTELGGTNFKKAIGQTLLFTAVEHGVRMNEEKTRKELKGKFFENYFESVKGANLKKWGDGGRLQSDLGHVAMGGILGKIRCQNSPKCESLEFGINKAYFKEKLKDLGWAAAWSTQFELGPFSEAAIGNVTGNKMAMKDLVTTPVLGVAAQIGFDFYNKKTRKWQNSENRLTRIVLRSLDPIDVVSKAMAFKNPYGGKK